MINRSMFHSIAFYLSCSLDKMAENLCNEIKRLHKRKQLPITSSSLERMQDSESSGSEMGPESPHRPDSPPSHLMRHHGDKALFTFKQVQLICEGMIKEREDQLRERYESVLTTKLAEQYDAFVKFTYDQIQRRYEAAPSCEYILARERQLDNHLFVLLPFQTCHKTSYSQIQHYDLM